MNELLIKLAESLKEYEPLELRHWVGIFHNWTGDDRDEIEWGASYELGESPDEIVERHNFFGKSPEEALKKLADYLEIKTP